MEKNEKTSVEVDLLSDTIVRIQQNKKKIRNLYHFVLILSPIVMIIPVLTIYNSENNGKYTKKNTIKTVMHNTIKNGGELSSIKHIYNTRSIEYVYNPFSDKNAYYTENYPLSGILNDLLVDYLQDSKSSKDTVYYTALRNIITENEKQNPFDNLEENQKYNIESIQVKLDSTYTKISPDVIKIAEELNNKNQLVNKYLNKSDTSYYISILALIITIIFSFFQIYQNYSTDKVIRDFITKSSDEKKNEK